MLIIGITLMVLYIGSIVGGSPLYILVPFAIATFILGFLLRRRSAQKTPTGRFGIIRRFQRRGHEKSEDDANEEG